MHRGVSVFGVLGVLSSGLWSWGAGGLASLSCPGTRPGPGNMGLVQIVSAPCSRMRVSCGRWGIRVRDLRVWAMVVMEVGDADRVVAELCDAWEAILVRCMRCVARVAVVLTVVCS